MIKKRKILFINSNVLINVVIGIIIIVILSAESHENAALFFLRAEEAEQPPYTFSPIIEEVTWDFSSLKQEAEGSDLWPMTWAFDENLYTAWGDGGGFGGTNAIGRVSIGIARIEGTGEKWTGVNICGGESSISQPDFIGKCNGGIICIENILYLYVSEQNAWKQCKIGKSTDYGKTWVWGPDEQSFDTAPWLFAEPDGAFASPGIIQFGRSYEGARDNYVYGYGHQGLSNALALFRVPKDRLLDRGSYEFFSGLDEQGNPRWTYDISLRKSVFTDPNGISWGYNAVYHPQLDRYLLTVQRNKNREGSKWGIFDAPQPWGPWTTVAYYDTFIDDVWKFSFVINQKWLSNDGKTMWMVFSGVNKYDAFNVIKGTLVLKKTNLSAFLR